MNELFTLDFSLLKPAVLRKLESEQARIINGVARSVDGGRILQHLPFRPLDAGDSQSLLSTAQQATTKLGISAGMALTLSTVAVMGTVIACTVYLARKLDFIQQKIDVLERELQGQNMLFYAEKITGYFGAVESLRELLIDPELIAENQDLIVHKLASLSALRCELYSFSDNLPHLAAQFTPHHQGLALDFTLETIDLLPKGVFIESAAAYKLDRIKLGDSTRESSRRKHVHSLGKLREWGNERIKAIALGEQGPTAFDMGSRVTAIRELLASEENNLLLTHSI